MTITEILQQACGDRSLQEVVARAEFKAGFKRSKKGNLWREYEGLNLSVFQRQEGGYDYSIADEYGPRYSQCEWETELEALNALARELDF